jgi:hypothetical protein
MSVPAEALFAAGITAGAPVATLQARSSGQPVAFSASTADGVHLNAGDKVEFYGRGTDTRQLLATSQSKLLFVHDIDEAANQFSSYVDTVRAALPGWTSSTLGRVGVASDTQAAVDASLHTQLLSALAD